MALTKAQVSLVTVATIGAAPGGFTADLMNFGSQKDVANLIASLGLLDKGTNAEYALQVAKNLNVSVGDKAVTTLFNALEAGATRADATVDFANAQLVEQGSIGTVNTAIASNSTSTDLGELGAIVSNQAVKAGTTIVFEDGHTTDAFGNSTATIQTKANLGKDAGQQGKISADYTFELKDQIGENDQYNGKFLSPVIDRQGDTNSGSQLFLELLDLRAFADEKAPLERVPVDTFAFSLNGSQILVQSDAIYAAKTYQELFDAIKARVEELGNGVNVPTTNSDGTAADAAAYAKLAGFTVELGSDFTVKNQDGDEVTGQQIELTDAGGAILEPQGFVNKAGVIPDPGYTLYAQMNNEAPQTITKLITTNLEADNVGFGSQGATVNLAGQSASDKGVEEIKVTATNDVWFTSLKSKAATDHLARIELQSGSNGYFNVGTQKAGEKQTVVGLGEKGTGGQNYNAGGLKDVQQVLAGAAGSTAINSFVSSNVLGRYEFEDTGIYTADDSKAAITYNLSSGTDVLNLAISTQVLAAVDTQVNVNTGAGNDVITVYATSGLDWNGQANAATFGGSWLTNQQLNDNIKIDAGAGNDWILTPGAGNATINAGSGDDVVRVDNTGDRSVFVFNAQTSNIAELTNGATSNSDNDLSNGANAVAQTQKLFKANLQVTFKGFESVIVAIDSSTDYTTNTKQINQAIKKAIATDPVLSKLIAAHDNDGNALAIESLIDGMIGTTDLNITIIPPHANSTTQADIDAAKAAGAQMLASDDLKKADKAYNLADGTTAATDLANNATTAEGLYAPVVATTAGTPGSTVASVNGVEGTAGAPAITEVLAEQTFDLTGLPAVSAIGDTITITVGGQAFVYTTLAVNETPATIALALGAMIDAGGYATSATGNVVTVTQTATNGAPIALGAVTGTGAFATPGITGTSTATGVTAVAEQVEDQTLDLSAVTVAAGESMIFTVDGANYVYTNTTTGALTGEPLVDALVTGLAVTDYAVTKSGTTDLVITQDAGNGSDIADITTAIGTPGTSTTHNGTNSWAESDNVINLGTGQDVLVMGTGALSNDTLKITEYSNGHNTIVNFTTGTVDNTTGADILDFTQYLNSVDANGARVATTIDAGILANDNAVTILDFAASTVLAGKDVNFADLTAANLTLILNGDNALTNNTFNTLDVDASVLGAGVTEKYVLMLHNTANEGEYKAFEVSNKGASTDFSDVKLIGTFDFGDTAGTTNLSGLVQDNLA